MAFVAPCQSLRYIVGGIAIVEAVGENLVEDLLRCPQRRTEPGNQLEVEAIRISLKSKLSGLSALLTPNPVTQYAPSSVSSLKR